jgi:hypothetical protein
MTTAQSHPQALSAMLGTSSTGIDTAIKPWQGVFFDGPEPDQDREGEEVPVWHVYIGDEDAAPVGKVYRCHSFKGAEALAKRMAKDRRLELIQEAVTA